MIKISFILSLLVGLGFLISIGSFAIPSDKEVESAAIGFVCCETGLHRDKKDTTASDSFMTFKAIVPTMEPDAIPGPSVSQRETQKELEKDGYTSLIRMSKVVRHAKDGVEQPKETKQRKNESYSPFPIIM